MRKIVITICVGLAAVTPANGVEFLGVELCEGSVDTSVTLPVGSPLMLESAEIGRHGGLLMLLKSDEGRVMDHIDELMESYTGSQGKGSEDKLQWSGHQITAYAQLIKKGYAALAISTSDSCVDNDSTPTAEPPETVETDEVVEQAAAEEAESPDPAVAAAAVTSVTTAEPAPAAQPAEDFRLKGRLKHTRADATWVDVMGVVVNGSGTDYKIANFDLSFYDQAGELVCVDTISVSELRDGQERAFRDSIRCTDYSSDTVTEWKLQFAGGQ